MNCERERPERVEITLSRKLYQHAEEQARARSLATRQFLVEVVEAALAETRLGMLPPSHEPGKQGRHAHVMRLTK